MTTIAAAIHEHGILRPLSPLPLAEGAYVEVIVTDRSASEQLPETRMASHLIRKIAALPMESSETGFSGRDHDRILYGGAQ